MMQSGSSKKKPSVKDMVNLSIHFSPVPSPNGTKVAYTRGVLDLKENELAANYFIYDVASQTEIRVFEDAHFTHWLDESTFSVLKHSPSKSPRWSDIYLIRNMMGEGQKIVGHSARISNYTPFDKGFVFQSSKSNKSSRLGDFIHVENESSKSAVYYVSIERSLQHQDSIRKYFEEEEFEEQKFMFEISSIMDEGYHITSYVLSPATNTIYLNCRMGVDLVYEMDTVSFKIEMKPEDILEESKTNSIEDILSSYTPIKLSLPESFSVKAVSPDGSTLIVEGPIEGYTGQPRSDLWLIADSEVSKQDDSKNPYTHLKPLSAKLDRIIQDVHWTKDGIYVLHWNESVIVLTKLQENGEFETFDLGKVSPKFSMQINDNGFIAFTGLSPETLQEVFLGSPSTNGWELSRITKETEKYSHLDFGTVESIKWTSKDGIEIEGLLRKPSDFDPSKKYPLLLFPHGGPRAASFLSLLSNDYYRPVHPLVAKGILVLEPNYRGSQGKGREFAKLNFNNMGVGDMWDIESGIDHLIEQGIVDETKIGSMGGSQGGYLSAFIGMHTDRCAAVSVNAGVSSWYIYYISSDMRKSIHIEGNPFDPESRDAYIRSAPISGIDTAKTPMLIQHGENDERISVLSAQELYRALKHKGVPTELFVSPGKGHGYLSPRENYAVLLQNYRWFSHYLLGEELDLFKDDF